MALNPRIHVNHLFSLYPRLPTPRNLLEGDFTFVTLPFNNAMRFLKHGPHSDATRGFPPLCFYDKAHRLTLNRIRDNSTQPTLTSRWNSDSKYMTVENCIAFCRSRGTIYAGVENGQDCCKCTSRRFLQGVLQFRGSRLFHHTFWVPDCGNVTTVGAKSAPLSDCGTRCVGDHSEMCGGSDRLNLYRSAGATPPPQPTIVPTVGWWSYGGCYR